MAARMSDLARMRATEDGARPAAIPHALLPALRRLDAAIEPLIRATHAAGGIAAASLRGMYVSAEEAARLLARAPGAPIFDASQRNGAGLAGPAATAPFELLQQCFGLSDFDLDAVVIALAPELDLRYERLYGFLQDDVTRRGPTVDLVLNLRTASAQEKIASLARFAPDAPLVRNGVVQLVPDPQHVQPSLLAHYLKLDRQIVDLLLGHGGLDPRLAAFARLIEPSEGFDGLQLEADTKRGLQTLAREARGTRRSLKLYFRGTGGIGKSAAAEALARELGLKFLHADLRRAHEPAAEFETAFKLLFREAWLKGALPYLDGIDVLRGEPRSASYGRFLTTLSEHPGIAVLAGEQAWPPAGWDLANIVCVTFGMPDFAARQECWNDNLAKLGIPTSACEIDALAGRFRLTPAQIASAAASARGQALWRAAASAGEREASLSASPPSLSDLFAGARAQSGRELERLARKLEPKQGWNDIVLPPDQTAQLHEICDQARLRHLIYGAWGFGRKLSTGKGLNVLFAGPPGTGKTMAAEVMATALALDVYKIDLSQVVSKYIGETEKNLDRIFVAAETANAILFFDEADALFGKRSEVKDSHDRYANIEIGYLLQKMEEYEGIAILATNLRQNIDDAFLRRLQSIVDFPFPDENYRRRIWEVVFPPEAPLGPDVDFAPLARDVRLAGGSIKNIAVSAAFYAAADGQAIEMKHLIRAARREHQKLGRTWASTGPAAPHDC
jgi:DNA polymerase III delta prime subunit